MDSPHGSLGPEARQHEHFLRALAANDSGKIIVANLDASLRLGFLNAETCTKFLNACLAALLDDPDEPLSVFRETAKLAEFQFLRQPVPDIRTKIALALRASLLLDESKPFLSEDGRRRLENSGILLERLDQPAVQTEFLRQLRSGRVLRSDAVLGARGILVWATRSDAAWEDLVENCERTQRADRVRDHLGLPDPAGQVYFELRTTRELSFHCTSQSRRVAAPTTLDAGTQRRFKQEPDAPLTDNWNRAIDLDLAFVERVPVADGAPELVIDRLSFEEVVWHRCLGTTYSDAPGANDDAMFIERLSNSRTEGRRLVDAMIASIVDQLHQMPGGIAGE